MHVIFRESHSLDQADTPQDLRQTPADLVVLSLSDSDLGAFASGWRRAKTTVGADMPSLRLANLVALKHPLSVDTYIDNTLHAARGILIRLIGGVPYWPYGLQCVAALAREKGIALAVLPADGRQDTQLDELSTLPISTLRRLGDLCATGGPVAAHAALAQLALAAGLYATPVLGDKALPMYGFWSPKQGLAPPKKTDATDPAAPRVAITFYRSFLSAGDTSPIEALFDAFEKRGFDVYGLFVPSLKAPEAAKWLAQKLHALAPDAVVNATSFSGKGKDGASPLDAAGVPVFQVALATSTQSAWAEADRGLSPSDLAMHVVLPEVDGRLFSGVISFKEPDARDQDLQYARYAHNAQPARLAAAVDKVAAWVALAKKDPADKQIAVILSTYPGKSWQMAHAVGLDALGSAEALLQDLDGAGYHVATGASLEQALSCETVTWPLDHYLDELQRLPNSLQASRAAAWGAPQDDPSIKDGLFQFKATSRGNILVALQPERGTPKSRDAEYHDLSRVPRHGYVAFYLWLRNARNSDAMLHLGAHGTLEWLPGKSVALSDSCWPEALIAQMPVIYPFIVNDPGEAAQAKRRISAVTLGHIPPPLKAADTPRNLIRLESLLDEFSNADGLDPKRRKRLQSDIRDEAQALGVEADLGLDQASCPAEALTRIDRFVCDVKESQFGDGLHIYGRAPAAQTQFETGPSIAAERTAVLTALAGGCIAPGPSGSPYRGRNDILPTGRNLFTTDPRAVPSRAAYAQGVTLAEELVRRHLQDEGDWPRGTIVDLWGSATMRTAGEEFAMALHLIGAKPIWDDGSDRVSGVEIVPIALLDRPRIDVTLRVSGLFRDVFPTLSTLFEQALTALRNRDEAADWNPYAGHAPSARVYGPAPGSYGLGMGAALDDYSETGRKQAGAAWLAASSWSLNGAQAQQDPAGIAARVRQADSFVHLQDLPETDLLLAEDYATHEAGFAAAQSVTGGKAALYHLDNTDPNAPTARSLPEEIARVVRGRATQPDWIAGMRRHGFRGAAEIAATLDHMAAFAHLADAVPAHLFDLYYDATLADDEVIAFLQEANPQALDAMRRRFAALLEAGLWQTRRNTIRHAFEKAS